MVRRSIRRAGGAAQDLKRQAATAVRVAPAESGAAAGRIRCPAESIPQPGGTRTQAETVADRVGGGRITRVPARVGTASGPVYPDAAGTGSRPHAGAARPCGDALLRICRNIQGASRAKQAGAVGLLSWIFPGQDIR